MANNLDAFSPEYRSARTQRLLKTKLVAREIANMEEQSLLRDGDVVHRPYYSDVVVNNYTKYAASYYLCLPLHLTAESFTDSSIDWSSRYALEARVYRQSGTDKVYYYERPEGGFILKCFAVNKELLITNYALWEESQMVSGFEWPIESIVDCSCSAKWNITVEYDANGYLVSEKFQTINASNDNLDTCCYGLATYNYS
jgi:hypothetical protein